MKKADKAKEAIELAREYINDEKRYYRNIELGRYETADLFEKRMNNSFEKISLIVGKYSLDIIDIYTTSPKSALRFVQAILRDD